MCRQTSVTLCNSVNFQSLIKFLRHQLCTLTFVHSLFDSNQKNNHPKYYTHTKKDTVLWAVPELPRAGGRSCEVCGCRTPPCIRTGADVGLAYAPSLLSRRYTAASVQGQLLHPGDTATHSQASPPLTCCSVNLMTSLTQTVQIAPVRKTIHRDF